MGDMAGLSDSTPWDSDSKEKGQLTNQPQNGRVGSIYKHCLLIVPNLNRVEPHRQGNSASR